MTTDCVLHFIILAKSKEDVRGYFNITYFYGDGNQITSKNEDWYSAMERFPPSLDEYCVMIDGEKVCPKRIRIWEKIVEHIEVTEDYIDE